MNVVVLMFFRVYAYKILIPDVKKIIWKIIKIYIFIELDICSIYVYGHLYAGHAQTICRGRPWLCDIINLRSYSQRWARRRHRLCAGDDANLHRTPLRRFSKNLRRHRRFICCTASAVTQFTAHPSASGYSNSISAHVPTVIDIGDSRRRRDRMRRPVFRVWLNWQTRSRLVLFQ